MRLHLGIFILQTISFLKKYFVKICRITNSWFHGKIGQSDQKFCNWDQNYDRPHTTKPAKKGYWVVNRSWLPEILISRQWRCCSDRIALCFSRNICQCSTMKNLLLDQIIGKYFVRLTVEDAERNLCNFHTFTKLPWKQLLYKKSQFDFVFSSKFLREIKCVCLQYWNELPSFTKFYLK